MDIHDLFISCRRGDIGRVRYLVEQKEVDLNVRDKWDSTPLYMACLCGHEELVKYMLDNGAKCEANTFDGERCLYGALTDKIKNLLKSYEAVTSHTIRRDLYQEFLRRFSEGQTGAPYDITFEVQHEPIHAHRCVLAPRSDYFKQMLRTKWRDKGVIQLKHNLVSPVAFRHVIQYLYTGRLESNLDHLDGIFRIAKQCHLYSFMELLESKLKKVLSFESTKPGVKVTTLVLEPSPESTEIQQSYRTLADQALPAAIFSEACGELPFPTDEEDTYVDVIFRVEGQDFRCHKGFFCGRSDYFKALIEDHFGESEMNSDDRFPVVTLHDVTCSVFIQVMYYVYQDSCDLTSDNVYDVLCAGDMYLLPGLKKQCAAVIGQHLETDNVIDTLRTARLFNLPRLEDQCAAYIAANLEQICNGDDLRDLIKEDAAGVHKRQETDSIPIVDDVRFHITNFVQTFSDMYEANQKLTLIDELLEDLQLDA